MNNQSFADLGVSQAVCDALAKRGFSEPFAIQKKVIGDVLDGRDVLAKSPTGSGKTLAFMVPLIDAIEADDARPSALVLAPTRELATQIVDETYGIAHARALKMTAVYGGVGLEKQAREAGKSHIIVATPGRLEDLLDRRAFKLDQLQILVLDEADRMLDMGFRPAVDRVVKQCPSDRQTLFFSATLDGEAGRIAKLYTQDAARHEHIPEQKKADIEHRFVRVERGSRNDRLVEELGTERWDLSLVFVRTKRGADRLVKHLKSVGVDAEAMHGDKSQRQRERALANFESGKVTTLIATDVAARGIHVNDIAKVINFDVPGQTEDYVHRSGRTGRAGERGIAVTFVGHEDMRDMRKMTRELRLEREFEVMGTKATGGLSKRDGEELAERKPRAERPVRGEGQRQGGQGGSSHGGRGHKGSRPQQGGSHKSGDNTHSNKSRDHRKGGKPAFATSSASESSGKRRDSGDGSYGKKNGADRSHADRVPGSKRQGEGSREGGYAGKRQGEGSREGGYAGKRQGEGSREGGYAGKRQGEGSREGGYAGKRQGEGSREGGYAGKRQGEGGPSGNRPNSGGNGGKRFGEAGSREDRPAGNRGPGRSSKSIYRGNGEGSSQGRRSDANDRFERGPVEGRGGDRPNQGGNRGQGQGGNRGGSGSQGGNRSGGGYKGNGNGQGGRGRSSASAGR